LYGSRHFAQSLSADQVKQIRAMFNVDMIGDRNLHIHRESHSDSQLADLIFRDAQDLGYGRYFLERPLSVEDDQMPFVRAGIPAVELISLDYGPFNIFWHTPFDTVGKCSAVSLGIVGRVLLDALDDLESGRTSKPLLAFLESGAAGMAASQTDAAMQIRLHQTDASRPLCPHLTVSGKQRDDSERPAKLRRHLRRQRRQFRD
jgi:Zn-dependent M28 family amino/carboxypeptidase